MFSFLRLPFLFCLLMFTQSTQAEPDFKIPPIQESMKKMYQIQQKDFTFEGQTLPLVYCSTAKNIAKTDRTLHLRWQCSISNGGECCQSQ